MNLFFILLGKISPLYLNIAIGYVLTRYFRVKRNFIATLLIYILGPIVILFATLSIKINFQLLFLPLFVFFFGTTIAFYILKRYKNDWNDASINTLSFTCGTGNTGYFGIPLSMILLSPESANLFIFATLGSLLYEDTTGFYVTAKGSFTARQSIIKVIKLPLLYAFILGVIFNLCEIKLPEIFINYNEYIKGAYTILGMMIVGMGLEKVRFDSSFDIKFISYAMFIKFVVWPVCILTFIFIDKNYIHFLNDGLYTVMFLFSIVPLAGNTVTVATLLNVKPQIMSVALFISTVISLFYIPLVLYFYMN